MFWIFRLGLLLINSFCLRQKMVLFTEWFIWWLSSSLTARECPGKLQEATVPFERRLLRCRSFFLWRNHGKNHGKRPSQWTQPRRKILMRAYKTFCRSAHANIILHEDSGRNPGNEQTSASPLPPKWTENHPDRRWQFTRIHHFHVICGYPAALYFPMC